MATNYDTSSVEAPVLQSAAPVLEGVAKKGPSPALIDDIFSSVAGVFQAKADAKKAGVLADFIKGQGLIADALDQGSIRTSAEARTRSRKLLLDTIDANPSMADDIMSAQAKFMGLTGGGDIIKDGSDEEQLWKQRKSSLVDAGLLSPDATDEELHSAAAEAERIAAMKKTYDIRMQTMDEKLKSLSLTSAERTQIEQEKQDTAYKFVTEVAPSEMTRVKNALDGIVNGPGSATEKQQAIEDFWSQFLSDSTQLGMQLKPDDRAVFMKPFENMKADYIKRATGEYTDAELKANIDRSINQQKALLLSDPEVAGLVAGTELIKNDVIMNAFVNTRAPVIKKVMNLMAFGSTTAPEDKQPSPLASDSEDKQSLKIVLDGIGSSWTNGDEAQKTEMVGRTKRILSSVADVSARLEKDPKSAIDLVNWFASSDFQKMVAANPSLMEDIDGAREALQQNYSGEVFRMINQEFVKNNVSTVIPGGGAARGSVPNRKVEATTDLVQTESTTLGMQFVPIDPNNQTAIDKAAYLNKNLRPIINTQIRASAHLDGRTDYGTYWEESASKFLATDVGKDEGDNLTPDDFSSRVEAAKSTGGIAGNVVEAGAGYTVVTTADGTTERRTGSRAWRNNNPGNIEYGGFAKSMGAVGSDGRFAVFASYEEGRKAKRELLFNTSGYKTKTIEEAIGRYAPEFENDTEAYAQAVANALGVDVTTKLSDLSESEQEIMLDAMEKVEGFKVGKIEVQ